MESNVITRQTQTTYKTSDGEIHLSEHDALMHQIKLGLSALIRNEGVGSGCNWDPVMIVNCLFKNRGNLADVLNPVVTQRPSVEEKYEGIPDQPDDLMNT